MESYGTCPFFFLSASALKLDPRDPPEPGYDAAQLGLVLHAVLEEVYPAVEDPTDTAAVLCALPEVAEAAFAGKRDNLLGLKENVIMGHLIPAGLGVFDASKLTLQVEEEVPEVPAEAEEELVSEK